jgi:RND superfamily putative drug exporter
MVLIAWLVFLAALLPTALHYTQSVNYSSSASSIPGSESARASELLSSVSPSHSTLLVVVNEAQLPSTQVENDTLAFQRALPGAGIAYYNDSESIYTAYAGYLDHIFGPWLPVTRETFHNATNLSREIYGVPHTFLDLWETQGALRSNLNTTWAEARAGNDSLYLGALGDWLWVHDNGSLGPDSLVQQGVEQVAPSYFPPGPLFEILLQDLNVTNYPSALPSAVSQALSQEGVPFPVPPSWVLAANQSGDFGMDFVATFGLQGVPVFLRSQYLDPNATVALIDVTFSVSESYRTSSGAYPAQEATPVIRALAQRYFGAAAYVTGPGAFAYDAAQLTASSGILFALTFVFLGVAVAVTLRSWIAPLLTLVLVSASTLLGYLAIELTGLLVAKVDFTVTYTLTAVTLGITTDYTLFLLYRYREELGRGVPPEEALRTSTGSSGFAILVSALTVAAGLGSLSFLSGLETWGPVLAVTVVAIAVLEVTILPALVRILGPRLFVRRWMRPASPPERSGFYRVAQGAMSRPGLVLALAAIVAVPAVASFLIVPVSYNVSGSLPSGTPSAQGQELVQKAFGANLLYPIYVIVPSASSTPFLAPNGTLAPAAVDQLRSTASDLLVHPGVQSVDGPFASGTDLLPGGPNSTLQVQPYLIQGGHYAYYIVYSSFGPYSPGALNLVSSLRTNSSWVVGGLTSGVLDEQAQDRVQYPALELLLAAFIGIILAVAFRSATIPLVSLSGVFLSISATTGLLYLISLYFLHAYLLWLIPLILFVILMSLGNDYTVFLLSRVREEQRSQGPREGIARGLAGSGVVVSALGVILAASLGSLALQPILFLQEIGIAFVISLLLDTFVVRPVYFPAALSLVARRRRSRP